MRFHSIRLVNFRCFRDVAVELEPHFNVIAGINGSGKTSMLKGICESIRSFRDLLDESAGPLSDPGDVKLDIVEDGGRPRFERQYPAELHVEATAPDAGIWVDRRWTIRRDSQMQPPYYEGGHPGSVVRGRRFAPPSGSAAVTLPVLAFYRADRHWHAANIDVFDAATAKESRFDGYSEWSNAATESSSLQRWLVSKWIERIQFVSEGGNEHTHEAEDELDLVSGAIRDAVDGLRGLRYDFKQKSLLIDWIASSDHPARTNIFDNLSDGQRTIICLVADIARRMCLLNPHLGMKVVKETPGVILIDELDVHLHPHWQRLIVHGLKRVFPAVQFIATSHSPQILGELQPGEIILLHHDEVSHPRISYGLDSSRVLEEIMGVDARPEHVERMIREMFAALEDKDLAVAKAKIAGLRAIAPGLPELSGAEALLKRKETIGR